MKHIDWKVAVKRIAVTAALCVAATVSLCGLMSLLISGEVMELKMGRKLIYGLMLFLTFAGAWSGAKKAPCERLLIAFLSGASYLVAMLLIKLFLFQEAEMAPVWQIITAIVMTLPAGVLASGKKARRR